jgi:hypothetical protein
LTDAEDDAGGLEQGAGVVFEPSWVMTALTVLPPLISTSTSVLTGPTMIFATVPHMTLRAPILASCRSQPMMTELALMMA